MTQAAETGIVRAVQRPSALAAMASRLQVDPAKLQQSLIATVFKGATNEELLALVVVANQYGLNPFLKQIYAFPAKGGGIVPIVGIDGWSSIVNQQPNLDGIDFEYNDDATGQPVSVTCLIYIRGRSRPVKVTEFYSECHRNTEPWNKMPRRMLRHKAFIQSARVAFGLGAIYDEEEGADAMRGMVTVQTVSSEPYLGDAIRSAPEPKAKTTPVATPPDQPAAESEPPAESTPENETASTAPEAAAQRPVSAMDPQTIYIEWIGSIEQLAKEKGYEAKLTDKAIVSWLVRCGKKLAGHTTTNKERNELATAMREGTGVFAK